MFGLGNVFFHRLPALAGTIVLALNASVRGGDAVPAAQAPVVEESLVKIPEITSRFEIHHDLRVWEWAGSNLVTHPSQIEATTRGTLKVRDGVRVLELSDTDGDGRADLAQEMQPTNAWDIPFSSDRRFYSLVPTNGQYYLEAFAGPEMSARAELLGTGFGPGHAIADSFGNVWFADVVTGKGPRLGLVFRGGDHSWTEPNKLGAVHTPASFPGQGVDDLIAYENSSLPSKRLGWSLLVADSTAGCVTLFAGLSQSFQPRGFFTNLIRGVKGEPFAPTGLAVGSEGSILIADRTGRILRLGPTNAPARFPVLPDEGTNALVSRLRSPSTAIQAQALSVARTVTDVWPLLSSIYYQEHDATVRARTVWLAAALGKPGRKFVVRALNDRDPNLRITGLRAHSLLEPARGSPEWPEWWKLTTNYPNDMFPSVRRLHALHLPQHDSTARMERLLTLSTNASAADILDFEAFALAAGKDRPLFLSRLSSITNAANPQAISNLVLTLKAFGDSK